MFKGTKKQDKLIGELQNEISNLKREVAILKGIQNAMPDPYYVRDMDYNVIMWSEAIEKLTGYSEEEAKNIKCKNIFKADVCDNCPTHDCIINKKLLKDAMVHVFNKKDEELTALVSVAGIYDENGDPIGAVEIVKDITDQQNLLKSIGYNAEQLGSVSEELAASSEEILATATSVNSQTSEILHKTNQGLSDTNDVKENAENCIVFANEVVTSMSNINKSVSETISSIEDLKEKSNNIFYIISAIQNISSQTNLLALNASIEAARAGEAGKGFAVVAEEIRKLAVDSDKSSNKIKETVEQIIKLVSSATQSTDVVRENVLDGKGKVDDLIKLINIINNSTNTLTQSMTEVEENASLTSNITNNQEESTNQVAKVSEEIAQTAQVLLEEFNKIRYNNM
jgi:PAS domain S-box-containing protein